ncbi:hypothetical protein [Streptomyces aurantiogriseus]|uniref:Secreted protein n=1 Tax=Streptomyces aurantiogriseus TaxID=66870 RepID=A0A918F3W9_9ACTN|nr:hypothetical protein [Streptomyces aurantiogriseus]GGR05063.1 hypothetical protein GCM10010251_20880 [Streptomyces aurantiogriseus]
MRKFQKVAVVAATVGSVGLAGMGTAQAQGHDGEDDHGKKPSVVYNIEYNCYVGGDVNSTTPSEGFSTLAILVDPPFFVSAATQPQGVNSNASICSPGTTTIFNEPDPAQVSSS